MPNQQNEAIVRRMLELLSQPQLPADNEQIVGSDWDNHAPIPFPRGPEGFRALHAFWHQGFPDLKMTIEQIVSDGDFVAVQIAIRGTHTGEFQGNPSTGKPIDVRGTGIHRCQGGKVVESWVTPDRLGILQQLGVVQPSGQPQQRVA